MDKQAGTPRQILIADDDRNFIEVARAILTRAGYTCECVEDGYTASARLREGGHDALVADIHMPGNELLQLLETSREAGVPVVIVTGDPTLDTAIASLRGGAMDYVVKPFEPAALLSALDRALARATLEGEMAESLAQINDLAQRVLGRTTRNASPASGDSASPSLDPNALGRLSNREREVARLFADAKSPTEIAETLGLSENTVRNHLKSTYRKLGVHSQLELFVKLSGGRR